MAVFGASGFVGRGVVEALEARGVKVVRLAAPRIAPISADRVEDTVRAAGRLRDEVGRSLGGVTAIVNAAGDPDASSNDEQQLMAANAACAGLLASVARELGIERFVHVSSAVVQGDTEILDETTAVSPFSAYSRSKALGEALVAELGPDGSVIYRPPSVHSPDRRITRAIHRLAKSPLSITVAPGTSPSPQALARNVGDAVAFLALNPSPPPLIVIHPWEGVTTAGLLALLGHRTPRLIPPALARFTLRALKAVGKKVPRIEANRRRLEMLWLGQRQASSWLTRSGWVPAVGSDGWQGMFDELSSSIEPDARGPVLHRSQSSRGRAEIGRAHV